MVCSTANKTFKGSFTGISIGSVTETQKIWRSFQALGDIAFAYSFSIILIEIQVHILNAYILWDGRIIIFFTDLRICLIRVHDYKSVDNE